MKQNIIKLNKDFFISNDMYLTDKNIEEYELTYRLNRNSMTGSFYIINTNIVIPTYSDEKCMIVNPTEIEITNDMPDVYIKPYTQKVIDLLTESLMTKKEIAYKNFMKKTDNEKFEYLFNHIWQLNKEIEIVGHNVDFMGEGR